jgi:O-antigen/teichoic acid export membrane protein
MSRAAISVYTAGNVLFLGLVANNEVVGYFSGADKLSKAAQALMWPLHQAIFPHISALSSKSRTAAESFIRKSLRLMGGLSLVTSILLFVFARPISMLVLVDKFTASVPILQCLAFVPFFATVNTLFGTQTMVTFGMNKLYCKIVVLAAFVNLTCVISLVYIYHGEGAALATLATELFTMVAMGIAVQKGGFDLFRHKEVRK